MPCRGCQTKSSRPSTVWLYPMRDLLPPRSKRPGANWKRGRPESDTIMDLANTNFPPHWRRVTLRSVCEQTQVWNPLREPRDEFWYVDVSAVSRESLSIEAPQRVKAAQPPSRARKTIHTGDVIFATVRPTLRRIAFVEKQYDNQIAST